MKREIYIGIMTGTSIDAIDIAAAKFMDEQIEIIVTGEYSFTRELQEYLKTMPFEISLKNLSQLNIRYTEEIGKSVNRFIEENNIVKSEVIAIGFHGQTLWHQPTEEPFLGDYKTSTYQLGSATHLAQITCVDVVNDFRTADMAHGGQGAPLIPIFDLAFLSDKKIDTVVLNIGGISNITYLPKKGGKDNVIAYDTGPGNCLIDLAIKKYFNTNFDENGVIARSGNVCNEILDKLMNEEYINQTYPKSTGKELFNEGLLSKSGIFEIERKDIITTLTHYTAKSIAHNIDQIITNEYILKVAGGGARNSYLFELLKYYLPNTVIEKATLNGIDISDSREALLMCYLAFLRVNEIPGNIRSVTGAKKEVMLGSLAKCL